MTTAMMISEEPERADADGLRHGRVMVVDDEPSLADLLEIGLRFEGWEVVSAGAGQAAVATARDFHPDVVVLDMMLPDMDGIEVMSRLRSEMPELPVLFLTARDDTEDRTRALSAGGDDYMTKPFSLAELIERVQALMRVNS